MLITESHLQSNTLNVFDSLDFISESNISPIMIPVVESARLGSNILSLESVLEYADSNSIGDLGYAVSSICEANNIDPSTLTFSVNETTIIGDDEVAELTNSLINEGVSVVAKSLSKNDPIYIMGEGYLNYWLETGDSSLLDDFISGADIIEESARSKKKKKKQNAAKAKKAQNQTATSTPPPTAPSTPAQPASSQSNPSQPQQQTSQQAQASVKQAQAVVSKAADEWSKAPRNVIAKKIAWLHDKLKDFNDKVKSDGKNAALWKRIASYFTRALQILTKAMHNFAVSDGHQIKDGNYSDFHK